MTPNEVYDDSQNQTNDWVHQLDKLDQSHAGFNIKKDYIAHDFISNLII